MKEFWGDTGCLEAVGTTVPIRVGLKESSAEALVAAFGAVIVEQASRAWGILLSQIACRAVARLVAAAGSPSVAWSAFEGSYAPQAAAAKTRLTQAW